MLRARVKDTIQKHAMFAPGDRVLVAVSGGPDSVCLLSVLHALSRELDITLHIAHLDHMFRGAESAREARFVSDLAAKLSIPATVEAIDAAAYCRERGLSVQAGAREVRYSFLERVAAGTGSSRIATGHTADDQAETVLLRLLRGAGLSGLSGIPPVRAKIVRPLIEIPKAEVLQYLDLNRVPFVSDPTNARPVYARNRVRLELLPLLEQFNPRIVETLATEAALLRDEDEAAEARTGEIGDSILIRGKDGVVFRRKEFGDQPRAVRRRLLRRALQAAAGEGFELSFIQAEEALSFVAHAQTGRALRLPGRLVLQREYERFVISSDPKAAEYARPVAIPGVTEVPEAGFDLEASVREAKGTDAGFDASSDHGREIYFWQAHFDYDKINNPLQIRTRREGDWFCPAGMGGKRKKLQDFFVDVKLPKRKRDSAPLLASPTAILWVVGFRADERFRPGPDTTRLLTVTVRTGKGRQSASG